MLLEQTAMLASVTRRFEGQMAEAREKLHWHVEAQGQLQEAEEKLVALQGQACQRCIDGVSSYHLSPLNYFPK